MGRRFGSHSPEDDAFAHEPRSLLADLGQNGWIDSRELSFCR